METTQSVDDKGFWENLYQTGKTPWDLGKCSPPLQGFLDSPYAVAPGKMAVLGCGNGNDCLFFAQRGFQVTGIDFSPSAIATTTEKFSNAGLLGTNGFLLERDIFSLDEYFGYYDYVLEHCTFCAIHPSRRRTYSWTVKDLLAPGGKFISLWWLLSERKGGPPFNVEKAEIFELFDKHFKIDLAYIPQNSIPERAGQELLTVMTRR